MFCHHGYQIGPLPKESFDMLNLFLVEGFTDCFHTSSNPIKWANAPRFIWSAVVKGLFVLLSWLHVYFFVHLFYAETSCSRLQDKRSLHFLLELKIHVHLTSIIHSSAVTFRVKLIHSTHSHAGLSFSSRRSVPKAVLFSPWPVK